MPDSRSFVALDHVTKAYETKVAVDSLSLTIERGTIFGLLGPNGAGKTSTIRMMTGITRPDSGVVELFGQPFHRDALRRVGYLPEERGLYKKMKVLDQLVFLGQLHGLSAVTAAERARQWCVRLQLEDVYEKKTDELSKGMQQKVQFIATLLHEPELVIMDEPFSGLDPVNAQLLEETLLELKRQGCAILFSSHRMDQVERLCDTICLVNRGRAVLAGSLREVKQRYERETVVVHFSGDDRFLAHPSVQEARRFPGRAEVRLAKGSDAQALLRAAAATSAVIDRFELVEPSLEEIFIRTVGSRPMADAAGLPRPWSSLWRAAWLIARREYLERLRSRAFLLTSILTPIILAAVFGGSSLLTGEGSDAPALYHVAIASPDAGLARDVEQAFATNTLPAAVELKAPANAEDRARLRARTGSGELDGYLWLERGPGGAALSATYDSRSPVSAANRASLESAIRDGLVRESLLARGVAPEQVSAMMGQVVLKTGLVGRGQTGNGDEPGGTSTYLMVMLLYIVVLVYGMDVARSVIQEKTSRIFEVLLATAEPESLMLGKLLGVGAAALTQVGAWCTLLALASAPSLVARIGMRGFPSLGISPLQFGFFLLYFVLGYLLYSGLSAGIGASLSAEQEIQQFSFVLVAPMLVSVLLMNRILHAPNSALAVALSFFPPCTPVVMYLRLCAQRPPAWQLALSVVLMLGSVALVVWIAARIYRVGILMYGKRATLPEMLRWLRYS